MLNPYSVVDYNITTATLTLTASYPYTHPHHYPRPNTTSNTTASTKPSASTAIKAPPAEANAAHPPPAPAIPTTTAQIDVRLVLPPIADSKLFEVGAWVSVVGYVTAGSVSATSGTNGTRGAGSTHGNRMTAGTNMTGGEGRGTAGKVAHVQALLLTPARSSDPRQFLQRSGEQLQSGLGVGGEDNGGTDEHGQGSEVGRVGRYEAALLARRRASKALRESMGAYRLENG